MGLKRRQRPKNLAKKLLKIRKNLGADFSQNDMLKLLGLTKPFTQDYISAFELGKREPPLPVLLRYAEIAGVCTDVLIDDSLRLPAKLPSTPQHSTATKARKSR